MSDLLARLRLEAEGGPQVVAQVDGVGDALDQVGPAADRAGQGARRAAGEIEHLGEVADLTRMDLAAMTAAASQDMAGPVVRGSRSIVQATTQVGSTAKLAGHEMLNLGRQASDVGVQLAMGMNPLMILVQQGPQIADVLAVAGARGVTTAAAFKQVAAAGWAMVAPIAPLVAGGAALAAVIGGTAALAARKLNQENKDLVGSLGLTEKQLARLKDQGVDTSVTMGDVFKGTVDFLAGAIGPMLAPIGEFIDNLLDKATEGYIAYVKGVVGALSGGFGAIKATWQSLPAVIGDATVSAVNLTIRSVETMINGAIAKYNQLLPAIRSLMMVSGQGALSGLLRPMSPVDIPEARNQWAGAGAATLAAGQEAYNRDAAAGRAWIEGVGDAWTNSILGANAGRVTGRAGDDDTGRSRGGRGRSGPEDRAQEHQARIDQLIAQAMQDELQVRLSLARDVTERASLQRQILAAEQAEKQAQLAGRAAAIARDKSLTDVQKEELTERLLLVELIQELADGTRLQALENETAAELRRQANDLLISEREGQIDLLSAQADLTRSASARALIEEKILDAQHEIERLKLQEIIESEVSTGHELAIAQARLNVLGLIQEKERQQLAQQTRLVDVIGEATDAARGLRNAWGRKDFAGLLDNLAIAIETTTAAFNRHGMAGGLMTAGSTAATLIGGKTGRAVGTSLGVAGMGLSFGAYMGSGAGLAMAGGLGGAIGGAAGAGIANGLVALGSAAPPLAIAAAALYAAAKIFNLGGKPTNAGAGYNLVTGAISGDKRTSETENAARTAAVAILQATQMLGASGITAGSTVNGLVIGTRDESQITMSDGRTVTSAVGNAAEAVDAAMRAMLQGATYQTEAQKSLVESLVAAGKGFEDITAALERYAQAQSLLGGIDDAILQLTDPKAWALEELRRAQEAQRDALKAAADAGYITAEQFAAAGDKLATLEGLQLDQVLARFSDAVEDSIEALQRQARELTGAVGDRILELTNPIAFAVKRINDEIDAKIAEANPLIAAGVMGGEILEQLELLRGLELDSYFASLADQVNESARAFEQARPRLLAWLDELRAGPSSELSPKAQREEAMRQYQRELGKAQGGDPNAVSNILAYADRLLEADRAATSSATDRKSLRDQVMGQIEGLAGMGGAAASPAAAIAALQAPLGTIARSAEVELAAAAGGGKLMQIANLPAMSAMYGAALTAHGDRLVAANDRNTAEVVSALKTLAEGQSQTLAALQAMTAEMNGAVSEVAAQAAATARQIASGLGEIAEEQRYSGARAAGGGWVAP